MINKIIDLLKKESTIQFIKFGMIGALNTFLNLGIYYFCIYLGAHYVLANATGWFITVFISYILNNLFTFRGDDKPTWSLFALIKVYISYSVSGLFLNTLLLWLWVDVCGISSKIAPIINMCFSIPLNFVLNKYWAYGKAKKEKN